MEKLDFNTVRKLTGQGRYKSECPLDFLNQKIENFIEKYDLDINPDFQRGHVWTELQQQLFVEFILLGGKMQPLLFNHPDWMNNFKGRMVLVDGKQRMTALLKFLNNDLEVFGHLFSDIENINLSIFDVPIVINDLKTRKEVLQWYLELNSGGTPHTEAEIDKVYQLLENE